MTVLDVTGLIAVMCALYGFGMVCEGYKYMATEVYEIRKEQEATSE